MLFLLRLVARLPLPLLHALGAVVGWTVYLCSPRYRRDFKRNLATAGLSDFRLRRAAVAEAGKSVMEVPAVWLRPLARVADLVVEVNGWEHMEDGAKRGKGKATGVARARPMRPLGFPRQPVALRHPSE